MKRPLTDADVVAAIKANHLRANVAGIEAAGLTLDWSKAMLDTGGTIFGKGPYCHVPALRPGLIVERWVRVYPPERLRKRLARDWVPGS